MFNFIFKKFIFYHSISKNYKFIIKQFESFHLKYWVAKIITVYGFFQSTLFTSTKTLIHSFFLQFSFFFSLNNFEH